MSMKFDHPGPVDVQVLTEELAAQIPGASASYGHSEQAVYVFGAADPEVVQAIIDAHDPSIARSREALRSGKIAPRTSPLFRSVSNLRSKEIKARWQKQIRPSSQQT
jgi:hypothetical protein